MGVSLFWLLTFLAKVEPEKHVRGVVTFLAGSQKSSQKRTPQCGRNHPRRTLTWGRPRMAYLAIASYDRDEILGSASF